MRCNAVIYTYNRFEPLRIVVIISVFTKVKVSIDIVYTKQVF